jgi:hypothetical protein
MDFDPRDFDSRDDDRCVPRDVNDVLDRKADDAGSLGQGPGSARESDSADRGHDPRDDARWLDRDDARDRSFDAREPFTRDLDLPCGPERELVRDRDREYTLRGSETRTLATIGAFRVVSSGDLRDHHSSP